MGNVSSLRLFIRAFKQDRKEQTVQVYFSHKGVPNYISTGISVGIDEWDAGPMECNKLLAKSSFFLDFLV